MKKIVILLFGLSSLVANAQHGLLPVEVCKAFQIKIVKTEQREKNGCCFSVIVNNLLRNVSGTGYPNRLKLSVDKYSEISISDVASGWKEMQETVTTPKNTLTLKRDFSTIPHGSTNVGYICIAYNPTDSFFVYYEWLDKDKKRICKGAIKVGCERDRRIVTDSTCSSNLILNGNFIEGNLSGIMPTGRISSWMRGYGSPTVYNDPDEGCWDIGYIGLSGNRIIGQSIRQSFVTNNKIISGRRYRLRVSIRFIAQKSTADYVKIRAVAFNNSLSSPLNHHPVPNTDIAIIGTSPKIRECAEWSVYEFPIWTANKDFDNILINAENNEKVLISYALIDNISLCDVNEVPDCNGISIDERGNPIIPSSISNYQQSDCLPERESINILNGNVNDLYGNTPGFVPGTDTWYQNFSPACFSVGGTLPESVTNYNCDDSLKALGFNMSCKEFDNMVNKQIDVKEIETNVKKINPLSNNNCTTKKFIPDPSLPFGGRDIIFIHGLKLDHLCDKENGVRGADKTWPDDISEFYNGYYKEIAERGWADHIWNFLQNRQANNHPTNRYLVVSYNCNQRLESGVDAVLNQIRDAMETGRGVVPNKKGGNVECFAREYVIISHSTGGLLTDVMLSIMDKTTSNPDYQNRWGNLGFMLAGCKLHVALHPAFSGSNMAKIFVDGNVNSILSSLLLSSVSMPKACTNPAWIKPASVVNSILIDLIPEYSQQRWGPYIASVPVDVLTVAGGQNGSFMHKGMDDGVLSMDCQCANPTSYSLLPTVYHSASNYLSFDMGIPTDRAVRNYIQEKDGNGFNVGCTPFLSSTGMVQPFNYFPVNTLARYPRHYSFIQSASDHMIGPRGFGGQAGFPLFSAYPPFNINNAVATSAYKLPNMDYPSKHGPNWEEVRVITDQAVFSKGLVSSTLIDAVHEEVRGEKISYTITIPWFLNWRRKKIKRTYSFWLWKRTYHLLNNSNTQTECDYVYKYVLR